MNVRFETWWIWMTLAAVFVAIEVFRIRSFFLWLSIGAAASGVLALLSVPSSGQIVVFIDVSGILILLERRFSAKYVFKQTPHPRIAGAEGPSTAAIQEGEAGKGLYVFRKCGDAWEIKYAGVSLTAKHSIGLVHIRNLIIKSGEWIHCSELKRISAGSPGNDKYKHYNRMSEEQLELENLRPGAGSSPERLVDRLSLEQIRKLRDVLAERKESGDFSSPEERIDQMNALDFIEKYLESAAGKRGRPRAIFDQEDTDRKAVSIAINRSRNGLQKHTGLYIHLKSFIQAEGNSFRYLPDRPIYWKTE
jgi:membrane protein implicated in regulation of membrane protease activity